MRKNKKPPKFLQSALWSNNISKMRIDNPRDKKEIIMQVLNCGTEEQVKWLFQIYQPREIKRVLKEPRRGTWYPRSLNFWTRILDVKVPTQKYQEAILDINPKF
ncbi:hypothetical protein KKD19_03955 [Patescibacteria group bacterium]|nr:hypothetical protein [Patescibacteria group bacterium]MBU4512361.1 hypothetical protein [Patescibacteria group bacterium]MCG2692787.1 hypothetical protein [Candidatus Parcubacteria bacterium]